MARLILFTRNNAPRQIELVDDRTRIGRETDNDLQIDRPRVSRRHAELWVKNAVTWVRDLGSSNGTFVNGRPVQQQALRHGDVVRIGDCDIRFLTRNLQAEPVGELALAS